MQGEGELDDSEVRSQVATGARHRLHDEFTDLSRELVTLDKRERLEIGR